MPQHILHIDSCMHITEYKEENEDTGGLNTWLNLFMFADLIWELEI